MVRQGRCAGVRSEAWRFVGVTAGAVWLPRGSRFGWWAWRGRVHGEDLGAAVSSHTCLTDVVDGAGMGGPVLDSRRTPPAGTDWTGRPWRPLIPLGVKGSQV